jgi:hypothetical protein
MGLTRPAMPAGIGGMDIAALAHPGRTQGDALQLGSGKTFGLPGQGFRPDASKVEGDHHTDTHIRRRLFFGRPEKMSSRTQAYRPASYQVQMQPV